MTFARNIVAAVAFALCAGAASAQSWTDGLGFEVGASTLGGYVAPSYDFTDRFSLRAPIYFGTLSQDFTVDGNDVDGALNTFSGALMADYRPWANGLRVSGGLALGGYDGTGSTQDPTFNGTTISGTVQMRLNQTHKIAPMLSMGYSKTFGSGFTVGGDVGAKVATYTFSGTSSDPSQQAALDAEVDRLNDDMGHAPVVPFLSLHLGFRF